MTSAVSDIVANASQKILLRTDVNAAGTVTVSFADGDVMYVHYIQSRLSVIADTSVVHIRRLITRYAMATLSQAKSLMLPTGLRAV